MAQSRESRETAAGKDGGGDEKPKGEPVAAARGRQMPAGEGPCEFRLRKKIALPEAGRVVKENWVGRVCGRSVRVYRGAQEDSIPEAVRVELAKAGVEIGVISYEELGIRPPVATPGFVNLTQQQKTGSAFG